MTRNAVTACLTLLLAASSPFGGAVCGEGPALTGEKRTFSGEDFLGLMYTERLRAVRLCIASWQSQGVLVKKGADYYYGKIDILYYEREDLLSEPFTEILKSIVVAEGDWDEAGLRADGS